MYISYMQVKQFAAQCSSGYLCQKHENVSYDLKIKLLYYDAAGNNR